MFCICDEVGETDSEKSKPRSNHFFFFELVSFFYKQTRVFEVDISLTGTPPNGYDQLLLFCF